MSESDPPRLACQALACRRGGRLLFEQLDFRLEGGAALLVRGPNGSGKTSLLRLLAGLSVPAAGRIFWNGAPVSRSGSELAADVHYAAHALALKPAFSAHDNLAFWCAYQGGDRARISQALQALDLEGLADLPLGVLSAGQQRRVSLARLLLAARPLWLLDEPTTALDSENVGRIEALIAAHLDKGGMAVIATHLPLGLKADMLDLKAHAPTFEDAA